MYVSSDIWSLEVKKKKKKTEYILKPLEKHTFIRGGEGDEVASGNPAAFSQVSHFRKE